MSLKIAHLAFILFSLALSVWVGAWGVGHYRSTGGVLGLALAAVFFLLAVALAFYAPRYWAKMKELEKVKRHGIHLVGLLAAALGALTLPEAAHACAVCYGDPDSGQVIGLTRAVWVLLSIVAVVQVGFVAMFAGFIRRARRSTAVDGATASKQGAAE